MFSAFRSTGKQGLVYGVGQVASRAVVFLLVPVYTRHLAQSDFGKLGVLSTVAMLLVPMLALGLNSSVFRSLHDHEEDSQHVVIHTTLTLLLLWLPSVLAGVLFLSPLVAQFLFGDRNDAGLVFVVVLTASFSVLQSIPLALYRARGKAKQYVAFTGAGVLLKSIAIVYLVVVRQWGLKGVIWGDCLTTGFLSVLLFWAVRTDIGLGVSRSEAKRLLSFGLPLVGAGFASIVFLRSDMFFLTRYAGLEEVAVYSLAVQIGVLLQVIILRPLLLIWLPTILDVSREKFAHEYYSRVFVYVFATAAYLGTTIVVFGDEIVAILGGGTAYADTTLVLPLVILAQIIYVSQPTFCVGINLKRKTWVIPIATGTVALFNLGLNRVLVPRMGSIGAGIASVLSMALFAIAIYSSSRWFYRVSYNWSRAIKVSICLMLTVLLSCVTAYIHAVVLRVLVKLLVLLVPMILLYQWGFLLEDESDVLRSKLSHLSVYLRDKRKVSSSVIE